MGASNQSPKGARRYFVKNVDTSNASYKRVKGTSSVSAPKGASANKAKTPASRGSQNFAGKMDSRPENSDRNQSAR